MKKFVRVLMKFIVCAWFGAFFQLILHVGMAINAGDISTTAAFGFLFAYVLIGLAIGVLYEGAKE